MALPKALGYVIILLVIWSSLKYEGYRESLSVFFEELLDTEGSSIHSRQKRETSSNSTDYELQIVVNVTDLERFQLILKSLSFPLLINATGEITSINTTTVCSSNMTANITEYQCTCEENFAWPYDRCVTYGACDAIVGNTCGCINSLPTDEQYCQLNTSQTVTTPATPATQTPNDPLDYDVVLDFSFPESSVPSNFIDVFRDSLNNFSFPQIITEFLSIEDLNFTTLCYPNSTGGLQCQCEDQFTWPCDKCDVYGACSNVTSQTCDCIKGLPSGGEFCEPITNIPSCPTPSPVTSPPTTTTPQQDPVEYEIVLDLLIPVSSVSSNFTDVYRGLLRNLSFTQIITEFLIIEELNFTTWCYPNSTGGLQCQCEDRFTWPCDKCDVYGACSNVTSQTCDCINGLPSGGEFCEPISSIAPCPTPSPVTTTTPPPTPTTTPQKDPVEYEIVLDLLIPVSSVPSNFADEFRGLLRNLSFSQIVNEFLIIEELNFTTWCYPNSTGGLQCQCEDRFTWPCDKCDVYGACSNVTSQTCDCINGLPSGGEFCEPITSIPPCPTPSPVTPPISTPPPTPQKDPVEYEIILDLRIPISRVPSNFTDVFRGFLRNLSFPQIINEFLKIEELNFTTWCYPNSTGELQCQCEDQFTWPCDKCDVYGACSNVTSQTCSCINGLPSGGEFCEAITNIPTCPTPTPVTIPPTTIPPMTTPPPTTTTTPPTTPPKDPVEYEIILDLRIPISSVPSNFTDVFRGFLRNLSFPQIINEFLKIEELNFTTWCYPNSTGELQCQCEDQFTWPCDKCDVYGACSNVTSQTCNCINGLPSGGEFCEPITTIPTCSTPISVTTTTLTTTVTTPATTTVTTPITTQVTTPAMTTPPLTILPIEPVEYKLVLQFRIPVSSVPPNFIDLFRGFLKNLPFPQIITESIIVKEVNFTTLCYPNSIQTGGLQCQCEDQFTWSCDKCNKYGACSNVTSQTCDCIKGLPSGGEFCEPITSITPCLPNTTTPAPTTTTPAPTKVTPVPTKVTPVPTKTTTLVPITLPTRTFQSVIDMDFDPSYKEPSSKFYQDIDAAIQSQSKQHVPGMQSARITDIRSGSTIVEYTVTAPSFNMSVVNALNSGLFNKLAETFRVIFEGSESPKFEPLDVKFYEQQVTVTCGPPPAYLKFGTISKAEWRRIDRSNNAVNIVNDLEHSISTDASGSILTVSRFIIADDGFYECRLMRAKDQSIFRQKSSEFFSLNPKPTITVSPIRQFEQCQGGVLPLTCSVTDSNIVEFPAFTQAGRAQSITHNFSIPQSCTEESVEVICQLWPEPVTVNKITLVLSPEAPHCNDQRFGKGNLGYIAAVACPKGENKVGAITATCLFNRTFGNEQDNCILKPVKELLDQSQFLTALTLPAFLDQLSNITVNLSREVVGSVPTIVAIVQILSNVANASSSQQISISEVSMEDVLITAGILTIDDARQSWDTLNNNDNRNVSNSTEATSFSSLLLQSLETITSRVVNNTFEIDTPSIILNKTRFTDSFSTDFNSSVEIEILEADGQNETLTLIIFASLDNVLPAREEDNSLSREINGRVVLAQSSAIINNISFTFDIINDTLGNPKCVFWNFSLLDGLGGWDDEGCELVLYVNGTVTCNCNHLTSFSILMSPDSPDDLALALITYIGVGLSMGSLVICLIIEAVIWRKIRKNNTSYLRHVSIVNIALSLLIADIWFIIGAAISDAKGDNSPACTAATFFIHLFYLALFFWMLASALLLLYRTVSVFDGGLSKMSLLAIGFALGYGAPLVIATITIAVTAPDDEYIRSTGVCWLNWYESKALLAFVIPALSIVLINLIILLVVLYKIVRRRVGADAAQAGERHVLAVIARSLAVLTPFFGLTWGLGVGTLTNPGVRGIHIAFAFFNSLQGFFILVFGTLLDKKVRSEMAALSNISRSGGSRTRSTSAPSSSSSGLGWFKRRRRADGYNLSSGVSGDSNSSSNT